MSSGVGLITQKILNIDNDMSFIEKNSDDKQFFIKLVLSNLFINKVTIIYKFKLFFDTINGPFIKGNEKEFINEFCRIQKVYHALKRFIWLYKYKKAKIVVDTDMCLNKLNINDKNIICILQKDSKYLFHINDILNISKTSLTNSCMFFSEPQCIKNPYNNLPFNKSTLYNIFFFIKYKTYIRDELFFKYFSCDFNLTCFKNKNEYLLRDYAIYNFVYKSPSNILVDEIEIMISNFNYYYSEDSLKKIKIDPDFPKDKLIKIMRPYLLLQCMSSYAILPHVRNDANFVLKRLLINFVSYNSKFGRKKYKIQFKQTSKMKQKVSGKIIEFDERHIPFNNVKMQNENFLIDHLTYKETNIYNYNRFFHDYLDDDTSEEYQQNTPIQTFHYNDDEEEENDEEENEEDEENDEDEEDEENEEDEDEEDEENEEDEEDNNEEDYDECDSIS